MHKFWNVTPSVTDASVLNMYVYGDIVTDSHWLMGSPDDVVAREFLKDLNAHPTASQINVFINSGGGEVFAAISMAQQLKRHKAQVHTYIDGVAASAATIIALAGDVRHMTVSSLFMVHLPSMGVRGDKYALDKGIEVLGKVEDIIRMTYKEKSNLSDEELTALIDHESWLTAEEAYKYGFITDVDEASDTLDNLIKEVTSDVLNLSGVEFNIAAFAEPEQIRAKLTAIQTNLKKEEGGILMDFQAFMNSLPVDKKAAVENELALQIGNKTESLVAQVTDLAGQVTDLTTQLETTTATLTNTQSELAAAQDAARAIASAEDADTTFLNSLPAEAKQAVLDARRDASEAKNALAAAQDAEAFNVFNNKIKSYGNLPVQEDHVKSLYNLSKANPEDFAKIEALFDVANTAMAGQFTQTGADGDGTSVGASAFDQMEKLISDARKADESLSYGDAMVNVCKEHPDLYNRYRAGE